MLNFDIKRKINTLRDILVGKVPDPKAQVEQITIALIYKFMDDMDMEGMEFGASREFFKDDYEKGLISSIKYLIDEIKVIVLNNFGDNSILLNALFQKGLTFSNLSFYDIFKFLLVKETSYNCNDEKFPKLNKSNLPIEISTVKYNIRLNLIEDFIINETKH